MWTEKIIGPPGTGKTTAMIARVQRELNNKVEPPEIGFYSFTRMGAGVALKRALEAHPELDKEDFAHFRTIHSECYQMLHLNPESVMNSSRTREFCKGFGYPISEQRQDEQEQEFPEVLLKEQGDWLLHFYKWRKNLMLPMSAAYRLFYDDNHDQLPPAWSEAFIMNFEERYNKFKQQNGLWDFCDMVEEAINRRLKPGVRVLFKDEAQDSSPLLYKALDLFLEGVDRHYIAGDPCQAIYTWQGARPELFESRKHDQLTFLRQSWRLPRKVHSLATKILSSPEYYPRDAEGSVSVEQLGNFLEMLDEYPGSVYILSRHLYRIPDICDQLYKWGVPFDNLRGPSPYHGNDAIRILTLRQFMQGSQFEVADFWKLIQDIPAKGNFKRGFKAQIEKMAREIPTTKFTRHDVINDLLEGFTRDPMALLSMTDQKIAYYKRLVDEQGEGVLKEKPRVIVGTIHSFKGDECDWAVILSDITKRSWQVAQENYPEEARVWYTGATRAKEGVIIVPSESYYSWAWPEVNTL